MHNLKSADIAIELPFRIDKRPREYVRRNRGQKKAYTALRSERYDELPVRCHRQFNCC
jgi:hypothetical protein